MSKLSIVSEKELIHCCEKLAVFISEKQTKQLLSLTRLLVKWNTRYNLVAASTLDKMLSRHLLDALSINKFLLVSDETKKDVGAITDVLDIGSGAGFPVLPLAIARPNLSFVSVETNGKKVRFQRQACIELGIHNVDVRHSRIEDTSLLAANVTSRAFTGPENFLKLANTYCCDRGRVILMLGQADRLPDPLPSPWRLESLVPIEIPNEPADRHVAICQRPGPN